MRKYLPLILLCGIGIALLAALQVVGIFLDDTRFTAQKRKQAQQQEKELLKVAEEDRSKLTGNAFSDLKYKHPKRPRSKLLGQPIRVSTPPFPHNIRAGTPHAKVTLTVFDDPACGDCRNQVAQVIQNLPKGVEVIYKFFPAQPDNANGGLFRQLAYRQNIWQEVNKELAITDETFEASEWARVMTKVGFSLKDIRTLLANKSDNILEDLAQDASQAYAIGLHTVPTFILNDYLVDGKFLKLEYLNRYIGRLQKGQPVLRPSDYPTNN